MTNEMRQCIDNCLECYKVCRETTQHCLSLGGKHAGEAHIKLLLDCAEICRTSADFMLRGSELHPRTCGVCAEVCQRCADACEALGPDAQMQRCVEVCRACVSTCRQMALARSA